MIKVMFVCYGNICRSPMAEGLFRNMLEKENLLDKVKVSSSATSYEEIGSPVYPETKKILNKLGISTDEMIASKLKKSDLYEYDYIIGMDERNVRDIKMQLSSDDNKIFRLLDLVENKRDIADPWYTRDFDKTYNDIMEGLDKLLELIKVRLK